MIVNQQYRLMLQKTVLKYLLIGGVATASYYLYRYYQESKLLTVLTTRKILKQIKFDLMQAYLKFAKEREELIAEGQQVQTNEQQIALTISDIYYQQQNAVLDRYQVQKQLFLASVNYFIQDPIISIDNIQMTEMMERLKQGNLPDLSVPDIALNLHSLDQVANIEQERLQMIADKAWKLISDQVDNQMKGVQKRSVESINFYDVSQKLLLQKGYLPEWGAPNQIFLGVIQTNQQKDSTFSQRCQAQQQFYVQLINRFSIFPNEFSRQKIADIFAKAKTNNYNMDLFGGKVELQEQQQKEAANEL